MITRQGILFTLVSAVLWNCDREAVLPKGDDYTLLQPENFPTAVYTFDNNPITKRGFELGRMLFYDPILSADSTIACANCHQQVKSFSDPVHKFSKGVNDATGFRNAPAIQNVAFQQHFFWDGGVSHLDFVPINAITSEVELHETLNNVIWKLQRNEQYPSRFNDTFGSNEITSQKMLHALAQFMVMMVSSNSKYDQYKRRELSLDAAEIEGMKVFETKCASCHATELFTDGSFRNNGLDDIFKDTGRERITEDQNDRGKFKVPSLRNVELTSPYMHDGRFKTLDDVLHHYRETVKGSETLDPLLQSETGIGIVLTDNEQAAIIAFLKTLTDVDFIHDKRFSSPIIK